MAHTNARQHDVDVALKHLESENVKLRKSLSKVWSLVPGADKSLGLKREIARYDLHSHGPDFSELRRARSAAPASAASRALPPTDTARWSSRTLSGKKNPNGWWARQNNGDESRAGSHEDRAVRRTASPETIRAKATVAYCNSSYMRSFPCSP